MPEGTLLEAADQSRKYSLLFRAILLLFRVILFLLWSCFRHAFRMRRTHWVVKNAAAPANLNEPTAADLEISSDSSNGGESDVEVVGATIVAEPL